MASVIANANRDPRKTKPFKPTDFMPKFGAQGVQAATERKRAMTDPAAWDAMIGDMKREISAKFGRR